MTNISLPVTTLFCMALPVVARLGMSHNGCPGIYPDNIAFNFTKDFFLKKVNVTMRLSDLVNRENFGQDVLAQEQDNYERFDGFSDPNDQAIVAKTMDGICFATFSATGGNGLMNFIGTALSKSFIW